MDARGFDSRTKLISAVVNGPISRIKPDLPGQFAYVVVLSLVKSDRGLGLYIVDNNGLKVKAE